MTHPVPIYPKALKKGDTIGVLSTSCWVPEEDVLKAKAFMEGQGYNVKIHDQCYHRLNQSAGTAEEKAKALNDLFADSDIKAIFGSRGGNRACTMLDKIDFDLIRKNPKILIGYSDLTILLNAIYQKTGLVGFHGPLFRELPNHQDYKQMIEMLSCQSDSLDLSESTILSDGEAQGPLIGGNMSVFQGLIGTPYMPNMTGAILLLEDVGDHLSRYDRMLCHLKNTGILSQISALIIGSFSEVQDSEKNPFGFTLEEIIREHTQGLNIPILMNAPFGHDGKLCTLPVGANAILKNGKLSFKSLLSA
ncbi:MAG TPA: LD-carboxypeptidase [Alphaproteobacteria bacterium]|nr:LD-carboxypeptidase [Alphaproteobacteria bacterium]